MPLGCNIAQNSYIVNSFELEPQRSAEKVQIKWVYGAKKLSIHQKNDHLYSLKTLCLKMIIEDCQMREKHQ